MTHTVRDKQKLLGRVRRIRGQVEAIERALESEAGCERVMHLIAAVRGATAGLMAEVVEDHVLHHLVDPEKHPGALDEEAAIGRQHRRVLSFRPVDSSRSFPPRPRTPAP